MEKGKFNLARGGHLEPLPKTYMAPDGTLFIGKNMTIEELDTGAQLSPENINHPKHYCKGGLECIDVIKAAVSNLPPYEAVCAANIIKYVWRYREKNGPEDLRKAGKYLELLQEEVTKNDAQGL